MTIKTTLLIGLAAAMAASVASAQAVITHGPKAATDSILAAERAYSARFSDVGAAKGMREFMDEKDGLAFVGGEPARGAAAAFAAMGGDGPSPKLAWTPAEVFAAKAGDMGASWGRYTLTVPGAKPQTGRYVTVWRRNEAGQWKAIMDIGQPDAG